MEIRLVHPNLMRRAWGVFRLGASRLALALVASTALAAEAPLAEDEPEPRPVAALLPIDLPLEDDQSVRLAVARMRDELLGRARKQEDGRRPLLVLEFRADPQQPTAASRFEAALAVARLLGSRELAEVKTIAWLPQSVQGHATLAVLACEEIAMAPEAELGNAAADEPPRGVASPTVVAAYREIAAARGAAPAALAASFIDPSLELVRIDGDEGVRLLLRDEVDAYRENHEVLREETVSPPGAAARLTGREGRELGFVSLLASDRDALAAALQTSPENLIPRAAGPDARQGVIVELRGEITPTELAQAETLIIDAMARGAGWIALRIDSAGGDVPAALAFCEKVARFNPAEVRTVAYVPAEARGAAAVIALSCDELIMHENARLGPSLADPAAQQPPPPRRRLPPRGPGPPPPPPPDRARLDQQAEVAAAAIAVRGSLAEASGRNWSLLAAMIDPTIELVQFRNRVTGAERVMNATEATTLPDAADWVRGAPLQADQAALSLSGRDAARLKIAAGTVEGFDQLLDHYGVEDAPLVEPSWALRLVQVLRDPTLAGFLLFLGFIGAYVELKTPGIGVGALVALVSFALFFWSRYLDQTAGSLEIVMFLLGVALLLTEALIIPGFGLFGLAGGVLILASLVLASQTFVIPRTQEDMDQLRRSLTIVAAAGVGVVAAGIALRNVLPKAPIFNRLVLGSPPPEEQIVISHRETLADYSFLLGTPGEAITDLRPAGKAQFGEHLIDVIAEGMPIDRGTPLEIASAHATRVVVRPSGPRA